MTAVTLVPVPRGWWPGGGKFVVTTVALVGAVVLFIQLCSASNEPVGFVGWEPHSGRGQSCFLFTLLQGVNVF